MVLRILSTISIHLLLSETFSQDLESLSMSSIRKFTRKQQTLPLTFTKVTSTEEGYTQYDITISKDTITEDLAGDWSFKLSLTNQTIYLPAVVSFFEGSVPTSVNDSKTEATIALNYNQTTQEITYGVASDTYNAPQLEVSYPTPSTEGGTYKPTISITQTKVHSVKGFDGVTTANLVEVTPQPIYEFSGTPITPSSDGTLTIPQNTTDKSINYVIVVKATSYNKTSYNSYIITQPSTNDVYNPSRDTIIDTDCEDKTQEEKPLQGSSVTTEYVDKTQG